MIAYEALDLSAEETWRKWGLTKPQLAVAGGTVGGIAGLSVDAMTAGVTHGVAAVLGAIGGATTAYLKGDQLPEPKLEGLSQLDSVKSLGRFLGSKQRSTDGSQLKMSVGQSMQLPWILFDRALNWHSLIQEQAHGIRQSRALQLSDNEQAFSQELSYEERRLLQKWFSGCVKRKPSPQIEADVFELLYKLLTEERSGENNETLRIKG